MNATKMSEQEVDAKLEELDLAASEAEMNAERLEDADRSGAHEREKAAKLWQEYEALAKANGISLSGDPEEEERAEEYETEL